MSPGGPSKITVEEFLAVLDEGMPSAKADGTSAPGPRRGQSQRWFDVVSLARDGAVIRMTAGEADLRPGGTVSGPTLFSLADLAMYAAVMGAIGRRPLAVTTDATVHFLRKPRPGALVARARLLKVGQRLVVGEVAIEGEGEPAGIVMHAVMTYAVPEGTR
jgi:uncharacterized protein (TIGR00369 family)